MAPLRCFIVPPYLLSAIVDSTDNAHEIRESARAALQFQTGYADKRKLHFDSLTTPRGLRRPEEHPAVHGIVPDTLLKHIADNEDVDPEARRIAQRDLEHIQHAQAKYQESQGIRQQKALAADSEVEHANKPRSKKYRAVYDAEHTMNQSHLPGKVRRVEGQKDVRDESVNEAYDNTGKVLDFYAKIFDWHSIDNHNAHVVSSVHFGKEYENAFWDSEARQMVYGDGKDFLTNFTGAIDVIGHELTHAVTENTCPLNYAGQPGALNEHVSDVFGIMVKQLIQNEKAEDADWLIGEDCICPGVKGVALRSMKAPGTAYNDPRFGKDPQPAHMRDFRVTVEDNGGVHLYSGIPNKAFQLAAVGFGGYSWETAGKIWWKVLNSGEIGPNCKFVQFAEATVEAAGELFGDKGATIVRKAWDQVGVARKAFV